MATRLLSQPSHVPGLQAEALPGILGQPRHVSGLQAGAWPGKGPGCSARSPGHQAFGSVHAESHVGVRPRGTQHAPAQSGLAWQGSLQQCKT